MKNKILKITSLFMSMIMLVTVNSGLTATAYAASKPSKTSVTSVGYKSGKTIAKVKKVSYKDSCTSKTEIIDYYELQYSENKNFKSGVNTILSPCSDDSSVIIDMPFATGETYYFRVRTCRSTNTRNSKGYWTGEKYTYSDWSSAFKYKAAWVNQADDSGAYYALLQAQAVVAQVGITSNMSDIEKLARVQNWINKNTYYCTEWVTDNTERSKYQKSYGDYGTLFAAKKGVCYDFAQAFVALMYVAGIPCHYISSDTHAWNIIKIDGYWYTYDCESPYGSFIAKFNMDDESKKIWNNCQPHADKNSHQTKDTELYQLIDTLN